MKIMGVLFAREEKRRKFFSSKVRGRCRHQQNSSIRVPIWKKKKNEKIQFAFARRDFNETTTTSSSSSSSSCSFFHSSLSSGTTTIRRVGESLGRNKKSRKSMSRLVVDSRCRPPASYGCCVLIRIGCRDWGINFFRFPPLLQLPSRRIDSSSWLAEKSVGWQLVTGKSSVVGLFVSLKENERRKERNELALLLFMEVWKTHFHLFFWRSILLFLFHNHFQLMALQKATLYKLQT